MKFMLIFILLIICNVLVESYLIYVNASYGWFWVIGGICFGINVTVIEKYSNKYKKE